MQFFISEISIKIFRIKIFAVFLERKKNSGGKNRSTVPSDNYLVELRRLGATK